MFCPNCGKDEQIPETYCRQCGGFLIDPTKKYSYSQPPEQQLTGNIVFNIMTAAVSLFLAIWLYSVYLGRENTPAIIYMTAAFLLAICGWQIYPLMTAVKLRNRFKRRKDLPETNFATQNRVEAVTTKELLPEADFSSDIPASVTENTTRHLDEITRK